MRDGEIDGMDRLLDKQRGKNLLRAEKVGLRTETLRCAHTQKHDAGRLKGR